jgi:hypothetical protein
VRGADHAALNVMHGEHVLAPRRGLHRGQWEVCF